MSGFKARGKTLEELFSNAARVVTNNLVGVSDGIPQQTIFVQLSAESLEELFVKWLTEVVSLFETESLIGLGFQVTKCEPKDFKATIHGIPWDPTQYPVKMEYRAVKFHEMPIQKVNDQFEVQVVLDV